MSTHDVTGALVAAAHEYRNRGWRVIQLHHVGPDGETCSCERGRNCTSKGKHPVNNRWQDTEPYSAPDIESLWEKRPKANVGIATGAPSGFWVLDIDPEAGGLVAFQELAFHHVDEGPFKTFTVQTGSGGWHYYFAMPDYDVTNSQGRVCKGVDVRGTGGQVVASPSRTDKGDYRIVHDFDLAPAPEWLLELVRKPPATEAEVVAADLPKPEDLSEAEWKRLSAYAQRAVDAEKARLEKLQVTGWDGEPWNATTFEVACALLEFANSPWCAYNAMEQDVFRLAPRDDAGFDDYTVRKIIDSAKATVGDKARPLPADRRREDEPDDLFDNPAVRNLGPTEPATQLVEAPRVDLFGGDKGTTPLYANMATAVLDQGPLAWGRDEGFWSYAPKGVWVPDREVVTNRLVELLDNSFKVAHVTNTAPIVKYRVRRLTGDPVEPYMNFANGMLDWRTGELLGHSPEFNSTIQFPYDWNPEATCPHVDEFLAEVMHEDYVALAWEMLGYLMLSGNPLQVAFLFYGSGGNGKGTLIRVIEELLGGVDNISTESLDDLNSNRFSAVNLFGRIANLAGDIDATYQETTANFKKITGEDTLSGERKYGDRFKFESWAVPVFSANKIPGSADVTEGYLRRWVILHFHKRITNVIPGLSDRLIGEVPGVAVKAVAALRTLMERKRFEPSGEAVKAKEEFANQIDQVRQWVASGDVIHSETSQTPQHMLYGAYRAWCERSGGGKLRQNEFAHRLEALGYESAKFAGIVHHRGLTVSPTTPDHQGTAFEEISEGF